MPYKSWEVRCFLPIIYKKDSRCFLACYQLKNEPYFTFVAFATCRIYSKLLGFFPAESLYFPSITRRRTCIQSDWNGTVGFIRVEDTTTNTIDMKPH
jgi:hypothetical protein